jgi:hypothetical protein
MNVSPRRPGKTVAIALIVLVLIGIAIWALFVRSKPTAPPSPAASASPAPLAAPSPVPSPTAVSPEMLAAATKAAWPGGPTLTDEDGLRYRFGTRRLVEAPFGPVLVSEGRAVDAPHVAAGRIDIAYLAPAEGGFTVAKRYPAAIRAGSFGRMDDWSVSNAFSNLPVIVAEGGFTGQGYTCGMTTLTELRPDGPATIGEIQTVYDDSGAKLEGAQTYEGAITDVVNGQGFTVHYTGTKSFDDRYVMKDGRYVLQGTSSLPA